MCNTLIHGSTIKKITAYVNFSCSHSLTHLSQLPTTALLSALHWLPVTSSISIKLACLAYELLTTSQPAYLHTPLHPLHSLYGRLINFSSMCRDFSMNLVEDRLVTWLLQSGMDYLLTNFHPLSTDFHPRLTPSNIVSTLNTHLVQ